MMIAMLQMMETHERRPTPAAGEAAQSILEADRNDEATGQHQQEPSSGKTHCLWCQRAFRPRTTGGSPQRFCSTGHRQAFWVAARRWTMRAVEAGLINVENLKVP